MSQSRPQTKSRLAVLACAAIAVLFTLTSYLAARTKSPTYDETWHATAADVIRYHGDYRFNPENPPLWQRWAALAEARPLRGVDLRDNEAMQTLHLLDHRAPWVWRVLYETPGNDAGAVINGMRLMMALLAGCLIGVICLWSWRLGGPIAAVAAGAFAALDPNLLAHAAMVKDDVPITLIGAAMYYATWRIGLGITWPRLLGLVAVAAVAPVVKFSGPFLMLIAAILLVGRAILPWPWALMGRSVQSTVGRFTLSIALILSVAVASYAVIWASYSFRSRLRAMDSDGTCPNSSK